MEECAGVERPPVWLMRQAGRYLPEFYQISSQYPFRQRSETASLALELTMQPYRRFQPDGVIFFSDILTPLPALGSCSFGSAYCMMMMWNRAPGWVF